METQPQVEHKAWDHTNCKDYPKYKTSRVDWNVKANLTRFYIYAISNTKIVMWWGAP